MPNKIKIDDLENLLPDFVKIVRETYRGVRYKADFLDTDYNEQFSANVHSVIKLQHGCKSRSNDMRSKTNTKKFKGKQAGENKTPIEEVKKNLPDFLIIDESSYSGVRNKAKFYDKEYNVHFEAAPANMIRGKGYCKERNMAETKKLWTVTAQDIQKRVQEIYSGRIDLVEDSYINTGKSCKWLVDKNKIIISHPSQILAGKYFARKELERWKARVLVRDDFTCQRCQSEEKVQTHHIEPWSKNEQLRFDVNNGICLCKKCHDLYHSLVKNEETLDNFKDFMKKDLTN